MMEAFTLGRYNSISLRWVWADLKLMRSHAIKLSHHLPQATLLHASGVSHLRNYQMVCARYIAALPQHTLRQ